MAIKQIIEKARKAVAERRAKGEVQKPLRKIIIKKKKKTKKLRKPVIV